LFIFNEEREDQDPMILCSNITGLKMLHSVKHIVMDGTFCYAPKPFYQVYTINAAHLSLPNRAESTLIGIALLKNKTRETYRKMYDNFSLKLYEEFGSVGCNKV